MPHSKLKRRFDRLKHTEVTSVICHVGVEKTVTSSGTEEAAESEGSPDWSKKGSQNVLELQSYNFIQGKVKAEVMAKLKYTQQCS